MKNIILEAKNTDAVVLDQGFSVVVSKVDFLEVAVICHKSEKQARFTQIRSCIADLRTTEKPCLTQRHSFGLV